MAGFGGAGGAMARRASLWALWWALRAEGQDVTLRFGISLAKTGIVPRDDGRGFPDEPCFWCGDAEDGMRFWEQTVNSKEIRTAAGRRLRVQLDIRNDFANKTQCLLNYRDMIPVTDYLLGPSYLPWNEAVKELAESYGKIMILWMANHVIYNVPPFIRTSMEMEPWFESKRVERRLGAEDDDEWEDGLNTSSCSSVERPSDNSTPSLAGDPFATAKASSWLLRQQERLPPGLDPRGVTDWLLASGAPRQLAEHVGNRFAEPEDARRRLQTAQSPSRFTFDVNMDEATWALGTLRKVHAAGARTFLFIALRGFLGGTAGLKQCTNYANIVRNFPGVSWSYVFDAAAFIGYALDMGVVQWLNAEVLVHCGTYSAQVGFFNGLAGYRIAAAAYVSSFPIMLRTRTFASTRSYALEPSPFEVFEFDQACHLFGNLGSFVDDFSTFRGRTPGYAALQTAAALTLLTQAVRRAPALNAMSIAAFLRGLNASDPIQHFLGSFQFDADGRRTSAGTGTRQILPLPRSITGQDRYVGNRVLFISPSDPRSCTLLDDLDSCSALQSIFYPSPDFITREVQTYPCLKGCVLTGLATCGPCPPGRFHSWQDQECRDCYPGTYADVAGMSSCNDCPTGGDCTDTSRAPLAKPTYFRINMSTSVPAPFMCDTENGPELTKFSFVTCSSPDVCEGSRTASGCAGLNTGMTCGQCPTGYTYLGIASGSRTCWKCPPGWIVMGLFIIMALIYSLLTYAFAHLGYVAAFGPGYVPCTLARQLLHYMHLLGVAAEFSRIDSNRITGYFLVLVDVVYRPLDLIAIDCLDEDTDSLKSISQMSFAYRLIILGGYGAIVVVHALYWLSSFLKNVLLACVVTLRRTGLPFTSKRRSSSKHHEEATRTSNTQRVGGGRLDRRGRGSKASQATSASNAVQEDDGSSISSNDSGRELNPFSLIHGPGLAYTELLESLAIEVSLKSSLIRTCLAWTMLVYPVFLRGVSRAFACDKIGAGQDGVYVLAMNYDIICFSEEHKRSLGSTGLLVLGRAYVFVVWLIFPLLLALYLSRVGDDRLRTVGLRRRSAVLFDGYRKGMAWWEVVQFMRTGTLTALPALVGEQGRLTVLICVVVLFFGLQFFLRPYAGQFRDFMDIFELVALLGVMAVLLLGFATVSSERPVYIDALVIGLNCIVLLYGFWILFIYSVSMKVEAIIEAGSSVSRFTRRVHRLFQIFPGVNPVYYYRAGDVYLIDVSNLNSFERVNLASNLTKTVNVCIDCSDRFKTWVVERAIHEAFRRAILARNCQLRHMYERWGTQTFQIWRIFSVTLRAPDIPPRNEEKESPHVDVEFPDTKTTVMGVTVDELGNALTDVNNDIIERHPCIFGRKGIAGPSAGLQRTKGDGHVATERGGQVYSVDTVVKSLTPKEDEDDDDDDDVLFDPPDGADTDDTRRLSALSMSSVLNDRNDTLVQEMQEHTDEYRRHMELRLEAKRQLETELVQLDEEYEQLCQQFKSSGGEDGSLN